VNNIIPRLNHTPTRDDLFHPFEEHFNKIWDQFFGEAANVKGRVGYPKMDILAENGQWKVQVALPGVDPSNVSVEVIPDDSSHVAAFGIDSSGRTLKISGKMSEVNQSPNAHYHVKELRRSAFERSIRLPDYIYGDPKAVMKDGLLTLTWNMPQGQLPQKKTISISKE